LVVRETLVLLLVVADGDHLGAVGVGVRHLEGRMAVVAVRLLGRRLAGCLDGDGPVAVHAERPLGDVEVVSAPIGHLAATVLVPPAVLVMATLRNVVDLLTRAEPHVPVELGRDGSGLEGPLGVGADATLDAADLAEPAGADDLGGEAKLAAHLDALLAARLEDAPGRLLHLDERLSLLHPA